MKKIRMTFVVLLLLCGLGLLQVRAASGGGGGDVILDGHVVHEQGQQYSECKLGGAQCPYVPPIVPIT